VNTPDFPTILNSAARSADRPAKDVMLAALQAAEIAARREKLVIPFESLVGEWRLCFATGASRDKQRGGIKLGNGYYFPKVVPASISFTRAGDELIGTVTNRLIVAAVQFEFTGPCRYPGKKNLLAFDFIQIQMKILGATVYQGKIRSGKRGGKDFDQLTIAKLPFFAFFWASPTAIAARGRSGGLALWVREDLSS
jgi:hypothetical protein